MKRILVFCDGTGQDGLIVPNAPTEGQNKLEGQNRSDFEAGVLKTIQILSSQPQLYAESRAPVNATLSTVSNILRLSRAVKQVSEDGKSRQITYYQSGVGTEADFEGNIDLSEQYQQAIGIIVASKIRNAYAFVAQNYEEGDEILLFGFSRGAYTARKVAGLIDKIGLLQSEELGIFFNLWKRLVDGKPVKPPTGTRHPNIKCLGVFDTVGSVQGMIDALELKDNSLPGCVDIALHALSLQENRQKFLPTLFDPHTKSGQTLVEVWFPGAHSDVGGSYDRHELADISLFWMTGEIMSRSLFALDEKFIERSKQPNPDDWGTSQPHNAYYETSWYARFAVGHETRLESGDINNQITFHESWKYSPIYSGLTHTDYMIARDKIPFTAKYAAMNAFETDCKNRWKDNLNDPRGGLKDNVGVLFPKSQLGGAYATPLITVANIHSLPAAPKGLMYVWLTDPDKLDADETRVPIFIYGEHLYTVLANDSNDTKMYIIAWDISQYEVKRVEKSGARYIWKIEYKSDSKEMTFIGQDRQSVTATLQELLVSA